jgi:hypothetical protein
MNISVASGELARDSFAESALQAAAKLWFLAAVAGQWMFAYYIAMRYGGSAVQGNLEAMNHLPHGYEAGNTIGNATLFGHLLFAATITLGGPLQLVPQIRARFPTLHRWLGRLYIVTAFIMGFTGLYLTMSGRTVIGDASQHLAININGVLIILCAAMAWSRAAARDFSAHRRWALRLFLVVNGVWFFRVGLMFWGAVNGGPVGFDPKTFTGPFLTFLGFAQFLVPLAVLELYLRAGRRGSAPVRLVIAAGLVVLTAAMGFGIFAATMGMWLPRIT